MEGQEVVEENQSEGRFKSTVHDAGLKISTIHHAGLKISTVHCADVKSAVYCMYPLLRRNLCAV